RDQTQSINSEAGLSHRFPFATLNVNARRVQRASEDERVDWTLPGASLSFSPVTLFSAPRNRAGPFNNMTLSGGMRYSRREQIRELSDDRTSQDASLNQSLRIGEFSLSSGASFRDQVTTPPVDSLGQQADPFSQSTVDWNASGDYKVDLMGSTTLRPNVRVRGALFRSSVPGDSAIDTDGAYLPAPTRASFGASLRTDLYGFFPGIGPFSQIRHKFSPSFDWSYSPRTTADEDLLEIPDFPGRPGRAEHTLRINLSQTFEAKIPARDASESEDDDAPRDSVPEGSVPDAVEAADSAAALDAGAAAEADTAAGAARSDTADTADTTGGGTTGEGTTTGAGAQAGQEERKVTLLSIRSDALAFDFERAAEGEPVLTTDRFGNSVSSDLLRGLSLNIEHDLFRGSGTEREFDPFLSRLTASFSFASGTSLGDIIGLGGVGGGSRPSPRDPVRDLSQADRLSEFDPSQDAFDEDTEAGPWNLSLNYSLRRSRPEQGTEPNQTLSGNLSLRPTPNWRIRWNTQYNITTREFGQHVVNLERDLHRWRASFTFSKSPNGNFIFSFRVFLTDAPDLKVDYDQRSSPTVGG
ncbi:MAG: putative LPS assembly protein LptD, partial [Gemmatimonadota bacterium]